MVNVLRCSLEKLFWLSPTTMDNEYMPVLKTLKNSRNKQRTSEAKELKQVFPVKPYQE